MKEIVSNHMKEIVSNHIYSRHQPVAEQNVCKRLLKLEYIYLQSNNCLGLIISIQIYKVIIARDNNN